MKILLANKFHYPRGGDCVYSLNLELLLKKHGHDTAFFSMRYPQNLPSAYEAYFPEEISFSLSKKNFTESLLRPFGTRRVKEKFIRLLNDFNPDVVHLNNIHSYLSPVLAKMAYSKGIKVVWTLHDYKLLCPRYDCLRNEHACELCFKDKKNVLKYKCMKNSLPASIIAYLEAILWNKKVLQKYVDTFICPSTFMKEKMIQGGFDPRKLFVLNNFAEENKLKTSGFQKEPYYCYLGRISHEKGVDTLLKAASQLPYNLKIMGTGPLEAELKERYNGFGQISFLGYCNWDKIKDVLGSARFMVIPSEWYENNPLSVIESHFLGTPVVGARIGGIPELIAEGENGCLFESGNSDDLKQKIEEIYKLDRTEDDYSNIATNAYAKYNGEVYYREIMNIYNRR